MIDTLRKELNVAVYCRLSREDGDSKESNSIKTQREIIIEYVNKNNWNVYNIYIDDRYSWGNFNRPAFKQLISDVEDDKLIFSGESIDENVTTVFEYKDGKLYGEEVIEVDDKITTVITYVFERK